MVGMSHVVLPRIVRSYLLVPQILGNEEKPISETVQRLTEWGDAVQAFGENLGLRKFRFHVKMTSVWLDYGHSLLSLCNQPKNSSELILDIQEFFSRSQAMAPRTQLRE
jgi:hypothetical protein